MCMPRKISFYANITLRINIWITVEVEFGWKWIWSLCPQYFLALRNVCPNLFACEQRVCVQDSTVKVCSLLKWFVHYFQWNEDLSVLWFSASDKEHKEQSSQSPAILVSSIVSTALLKQLWFLFQQLCMIMFVLLEVKWVGHCSIKFMNKTHSFKLIWELLLHWHPRCSIQVTVSRAYLLPSQSSSNLPALQFKSILPKRKMLQNFFI